LYLLYKEYKYAKEVTALIHAYLNILKISYIRNKKQTTSNLKVYEEVISNELTVDEYDQVYKTLSKAWSVPFYKTPNSSFADGKRIIDELITKIDYVVKDPNYHTLIKQAESRFQNRDNDED